ncbi:RNA-binding protein [Mycoplasmopsis mucosicanis]|uniref:RNA-binding protein n=1 Tax=Mycoplasmopsis mucosicanis TaxID=458208 RepID=A0A507SI77_9BACT|nr:RNA-binding protein [Mycoplasmopsis mucosicanis]TQC51410.1 RNA-binding protein [Mycoplasmopsis mucosicanis]
MNKRGDILFGKIIHICREGITVLTNKKYVFNIPKKNITDWSSKNLYAEFSIKDKINFYVEQIDNANSTGIGNFKYNHSYFARTPFTDELKETKHGFRTLKSEIEKDINIWKNRGQNV